MRLKGNLILLLVAMIWGAAFVAQRAGMDYIGPFTYTGVRFILGCLSLLPVLYFFRNDKKMEQSEEAPVSVRKIGSIAGVIMFFAVSFQQIGLVYTTAGKAAFITCLYIIFVPLAAVFLKQYISKATWVGAVFAIFGLYLLCVKNSFHIEYGDGIVFIGAFIWAAHILFIDHYAGSVDSIQLAFYQFFVCAVLSNIAALLLEPISWTAIMQAAVPILYGGIFSVGIAFTLQIIGQRYAEPSHAAIIMSMESIFGVLAGFVFLNESMGSKEIFGCLFMMLGMLITQFDGFADLKAKFKHYNKYNRT
ncbi:DMT family transporter [Anaerosinus massiliensis]|uniref:DMT family transporter n=1 Tax=Massilibacillus massiliensis TaxID=1806837 RepID=UPI000A744918|nr:DMT family transporter [Massilibacillus massiliensis]